MASALSVHFCKCVWWWPTRPNLMVRNWQESKECYCRTEDTMKQRVKMVMTMYLLLSSNCFPTCRIYSCLMSAWWGRFDCCWSHIVQGSSAGAPTSPHGPFFRDNTGGLPTMWLHCCSNR
jgi:hypothetical protein